MSKLRRRIAAVLVLTSALAVLPVLLAQSSTKRSAAATAANSRMAHAALRERARGEEEGGGADAEAYADRAYPNSEIGIEQVQGALAANAAVATHASKLDSKWSFIGPETLNVDRLGTQSFIKPTQWSGRVTALTVDSKCKPQECTLYLGAAGGGVWRTKNALAPNPSWQQISDGIPTNAVGSIAVDPNDPTGKTVYVGTGEANASADSEAGLGLYKTTDDGAHWSLVSGSYAVANNRSIAWTAIEPGNPNHILIGTRSGQHGMGSNSSSGATPAAQSPAVGVYVSTDGGATFALSQAGSINEVKFDPNNPSVVYAAQASAGLIRSTAGGAPGTWQTIFAGNRSRYSFSPVALSATRTRIYLADASGSGSPSGAQVYRVDDASQSAATLTASSNAAWTRLSNPTPGTPGNAVYNYCNTPLVGSQCSYDMFAMSPADDPDTIVVGGLMHYEELKPYAAPGGMRGNGRAVLMSKDAGATWTDVTGDVGGESMHPDQHALAFVPGNSNQFFVGSDGGVIRTSGQWADASSQCDSRGLSADFLADCHNWLSRIPTELTVMNAGLGTLQMTAIAVSPFAPESEALAGTQDNGTLAYSGSPTWILPLTGDGGDPGYDAVDPNLHFHTYTGGQMDINYHGNDPTSWLWIGDAFLNLGESLRFYAPAIPDPNVSKTIFVGATRVWRTQDGGGDRAFLEAHCNTAVGEFPSDLLYTGVCGQKNVDWKPLGSNTLTGAAFGGTNKSGSNLTSLARSKDGGTLWAGTGGGRVLMSRNANAPDASVTFTRLDTAAQPGRVVSSVYADPTDPNHALVTFSGYDVNTPTTTGHVFDVRVDPATNAVTWTNISFDIGDQPVNDAVLDTASGDVYISTDYGVYRLVKGTQTWIQAADGLPNVEVSGLTLAAAKQKGDRLLYAATHGRGAYTLRLKR